MCMYILLPKCNNCWTRQKSVWCISFSSTLMLTLSKLTADIAVKELYMWILMDVWVWKGQAIVKYILTSQRCSSCTAWKNVNFTASKPLNINTLYMFCVQKCLIFLQILKFHSKYQHFLARSFPNSPLFPTVIMYKDIIDNWILKRKEVVNRCILPLEMEERWHSGKIFESLKNDL